MDDELEGRLLALRMAIAATIAAAGSDAIAKLRSLTEVGNELAADPVTTFALEELEAVLAAAEFDPDA
jgi:hypothetical protein